MPSWFGRRPAAVNRTQGLVLGFFLVAWCALVLMLAVSSEVRDVMTNRLPDDGARVIVAFLVALAVFLVLAAVGVLKRWHWVFWLVLVAFAAGAIRVPIAVLQVSGRMTPEGPDWYVVVQGAIGMVQVAIAVVMFAGYRRSGPWGD